MRKARIIKNGADYHVTARINRQEMILEDPEFKKMLLKIILEAKEKYSFLFWNFCIMGNHLHLDMKPLENESLSKVMQWILSVFARRYNKIFSYRGHVWYDRFKSVVINSLLQFVRTYLYIANNPVRAGICDHPLAFEYSGITFYKNKNWQGILDPPPAWLDSFIERFLINYDPERYRNPRRDYTFRDKRPGRPCLR